MIVTLDFALDEDVTPRIFARRVAEACVLHGAIRPGEYVASEPCTERFTRYYYDDIAAELQAHADDPLAVLPQEKGAPE